MKTIKQVCEESNVPSRLVRAVIKQLGGGKEAIETLGDVYHYGADGGFPGFVYYNDTQKFYRRHRAAIVELAEEMASELSENVIEMIKNFGCLRSGITTESIAKALYGNVDDPEVPNALAWFTLEEVARAFYD